MDKSLPLLLVRMLEGDVVIEFSSSSVGSVLGKYVFGLGVDYLGNLRKES